MSLAVTFDYGQTLAELDTSFLSERADERGVQVEVRSLDRASPTAWAEYELAKTRGESAFDAWSSFMTTLLREAGAHSTDEGRKDVVPSLVDFLWSEQPRKNLWRRPIPGMEALVRELFERKVPLAVVSNSEGKMRELLDQTSLGGYFPVVADSGVLGFEKPDRRIFEWAASRLGVSTDAMVHVGDAYAADVEGALNVGARALWFTNDTASRAPAPGVVRVKNAAEVRAALVELRLLG